METTDDTDIAIVGLALRVPGATTPEAFWHNLAEGVESRQAYDEVQLLARGVPAGVLEDPHYVRSGMPLQDMEHFDPEFFGFSPKEGAILDPQHRHFYEVAWEALERAGHPPSKFDGHVGVFAGCGMAAYFAHNILGNRELLASTGLFLLRHTGNDKDFLATRVSYAFDLKGPSINVQTACSTSLVATHLAVQSLLSRECDMALAGGVTIELPHAVGYAYKEGEILSPDGHCRSFDHRSRGTVFGSGVGVVVLRRLADALADGDHIHAIIKGSAVNNDGAAKVGYLAPSVDGQAAAISEAIAMAGVAADSIQYVECHGTGTPVGDPIEITALTQAFRESTDRLQFCYVGSVKSNIGHLDTAAGVAGLIKAALALEKGQIPPSINYEAPNPAIDFASSPFKVADRLTKWADAATPRRAAVNSLGVGGTNAFIVLQQPPRPSAATPQAAAQPLVLSARSRAALDQAADRLAQWLQDNPQVPLADIAWTLWEGRHGFDHRRVLGATTHEEAAQLLQSGDARRVFNHARELERPSIVFMYPGGGAQYFAMGRGLYDTEPVFREHMDRGFAWLSVHHDEDLKAVFMAPAHERAQAEQTLARPSVQLPLIFLVEHALTQLWAHHGVRPAALTGHSLGENTAACVAGVFSFEDALGLVLLRGQLMDEVPEGAMLSVSMPAADLAAILDPGLDLATANSPQLSVASGPSPLIDELAQQLARDGVDCQRIRINIAAHSRLLDGILERFRSYLQKIRLGAPTLPLISNRTGKWITAAEATDPEYWVGHLRHTILFANGIDTLLESPDRVFLEVGPGNTLGSLVRQNPAAPSQRVLASMRHPNDPTADEVYFRTAIARLWATGVDIDPATLWHGTRRRVPLPTYPFQHAPYWIEPSAPAAATAAEDGRPRRLPDLAQWFSTPRWVQQGVLDLDDSPRTWLVFQTREPLADQLVETLRAGGHRVVTVHASDAYARTGEHQFTLAPEAGGTGYTELIEALAADDLLPDAILHTWLITWDRAFRPGSTFFHRNQEYGFYSLLHLAQALGKAGNPEKPLQMIVAGNGVLRVAAEAATHPDKATVLGPCAVIPREYPHIHCRFIDITEPRVEALLSELSATAGNGVFAWRDGVRWQRHLGKWSPPGTGDARAVRLKQGGTYLITGGLGGIAGVLAAWLAREHGAKLALLSRTPLPQRKDWDDWVQRNSADDSISLAIQRIRHLERLGATVMPVSADVSVAEQMSTAIADIRGQFGTIDGVFHAAGVIRDGLIALKRQKDIEDVFSAKVYGTLVLDQLFADDTLDFMVLFSSTSAFVAPQGQVDYAAANAFLNAFADAHDGERAWPLVALNWGVWKGVGMVGTAGAGDLDPLDTHGESCTPPRHPLLQRHTSMRDGLATVHRFEGTLSAERDWVISEHRLANGDALLPGTGYLDLIRGALQELDASRHWEIHSLLFQAPLYVRDGQPRDFRLRLRGDATQWDVDVLARQLDAPASQKPWQLCASARALPGQGTNGELDVTALEARCTSGTVSTGGTSALRTRQEDHLRFGPRWRVLKRQSFGDGEAIARLQLPEPFLDDLPQYPLHPGLLDIATGFAMDLIPSYAEQEVAKNLWAPVLYRRVDARAPLQRDIVSWVRLAAGTDAEAGLAVFDVTLADLDGKTLIEVEGLTLRRIDGALIAPTLPPGDATRKPAALSPAELALQHNIQQGIDATSGMQALEQVLGAPTLPPTVLVSSMDVAALIRQADAVSREGEMRDDTRFSRPQLESEFVAPRNDVERQLAELWGKLLGVETVGIHDSFFDLGGHSLIAVRLFNELSDRFQVDLPMSVLMQSPTIAGLAQLVGDGSPEAAAEDTPVNGEQRPTYYHLVPMHSGPVGNRTPLFVVAGMFGNVLNLSHLAHLLGEERPFYALQARGLFGDLAPHETFEEAASDYLAEIRRVQPHGPYLLGGFSGGGLIAYEMARQLIAGGEQVSKVILLDTPIRENRHFSLADKLSMFMTGLRRNGPAFFLTKIRERLAWEKKKRQERRENLKDGPDEGSQFQSRRIGNAFLGALACYEVQPAPVDAILFRPKLDIQFRLGGGRLVDRDRNYIFPDNDWTRFVRTLEIHEVPGNHDSMVLEPNVRILVGTLRNLLSGL